MQLELRSGDLRLEDLILSETVCFHCPHVFLHLLVVDQHRAAENAGFSVAPVTWHMHYAVEFGIESWLLL